MHYYTAAGRDRLRLALQSVPRTDQPEEPISLTASLRRGIDDVLAEACALVTLLGAREAYDALRAGAVLVDIRPQINRDLEGRLLGAVVIERNVLDWRLDPAATHACRSPATTCTSIVVCNEGYASSLAAAALQNLGTQRPTDLVGAYGLARSAGLPPPNPPNPSTTQRTRPRSRSPTA